MSKVSKDLDRVKSRWRLEMALFGRARGSDMRVNKVRLWPLFRCILEIISF